MDAKEEKEQHLKLMKQNYENSKSTISELKKEIIDKNHILQNGRQNEIYFKRCR